MSTADYYSKIGFQHYLYDLADFRRIEDRETRLKAIEPLLDMASNDPHISVESFNQLCTFAFADRK